MNIKSRKNDIGEISQQLAARAEGFCRHFFPEGRKNGNYWQIGNVTGQKGQSLKIRLKEHSGRKAGNWSDYASGEFGDLIDLLHAHQQDGQFTQTLALCRSFLGVAPIDFHDDKFDGSKISSATEINRRIHNARKLFGLGKTVYPTLASAYLLGRKIQRFGPALRYHSTVFIRPDENGETQKHPALLAKITDNVGTITGCAKTFLDAKTEMLATFDNPKRVMGKLHGNAIRFGKGVYREDLIVGEGLENTLSVGTALPKVDLASCLTANHIALFIPPNHIKRLWIARDNDKAGEQAANRLRERVEPNGLWVGDLIPKLDDFNNDLQQRGVNQLRQDLKTAMKEKGLRLD